MNEAKTLKTDLNVFEHFNPQLPESYKTSQFVFLANIAPELQLLVLINEGEAKMLTGAANAIAAAPLITDMGPRAVVIKRGEYGFAMYSREQGYFILPAMPIRTVVDPTGAGDTFAGGFFGYLAAQKDVPTVAHMKQACIMGSIMASHTIQDFSVRALAKVTLNDLEARLSEYRKVITI